MEFPRASTKTSSLRGRTNFKGFFPQSDSVFNAFSLLVPSSLLFLNPWVHKMTGAFCLVPPQQWDPKSLVIHLTLSEAHSMGRTEMLGKHFLLFSLILCCCGESGLDDYFCFGLLSFFPLTECITLINNALLHQKIEVRSK